ncbi:RNA 2',3'-cyclic phosphodiesterase [Actinacidiphila yeochonensis]|uniref:RNA 2',3'-cyclic phosphodiesterase n=1 Tax=Actinacidiphila yeochonensis TaxID=89050 RepID=UPI00099C930A|nr:RNA 2',3'-cyclic phosphodiesterase [Actinacidiphila yeochonensis]
MRLFVAVLPPPAAVRELAAAVAPLRRLPGADRLRWTRPEDWHLTLAFLGEVPDSVRPGLDERLARAARRHPPHTLRLAGGGRFGDHVLWTAAAGERAALEGLARSLRAGARRAGAPADEGHPFRSHLTLARTARSASVRLGPFAEELASFEGTPWEVGEAALVVSVPPRSGAPGERPRYEVAASWPLGRPSGAGEQPDTPGGPGPGSPYGDGGAEAPGSAEADPGAGGPRAAG